MYASARCENLLRDSFVLFGVAPGDALNMVGRVMVTYVRQACVFKIEKKLTGFDGVALV